MYRLDCEWYKSIQHKLAWLETIIRDITAISLHFNVYCSPPDFVMAQITYKCREMDC